VDDYALTPAERKLLQALTDRGVRFLIVGMGAAVLEGAPVSTVDLDLWFESATEEGIPLAARDAGGSWISGFGLAPPGFGGVGLDRIDVVLTAQGLGSFADEYAGAKDIDLDGIRVRILPLERVIASKRVAGRAKDLAQMPALEATLAAKRNQAP
jgi:hypothetical protein